MHKTTLNPSRLTRHCQEQVGQPRIAEVTEGVFIATGYDLANTILIRTNEGHVVVSASLTKDGSSSSVNAQKAQHGHYAPACRSVYTAKLSSAYPVSLLPADRLM